MVGVVAILAMIAGLAIREICCLRPQPASKVDVSDAARSGLARASSNVTASTSKGSKTQRSNDEDNFVHVEALALAVPDQSTADTFTTTAGTNANKAKHTRTVPEGTYTDMSSLKDTQAEKTDPLVSSQRERDEWIGAYCTDKLS